VSGDLSDVPLSEFETHHHPDTGKLHYRLEYQLRVTLVGGEMIWTVLRDEKEFGRAIVHYDD
jgi:hypothetical protein